MTRRQIRISVAVVVAVGAALVSAVALRPGAAAGAAPKPCYAPGAPTCVRAYVRGSASADGSIRPKRLETVTYVVTIGELTWSSWGATSAVGRGKLARCGNCQVFSDYGQSVKVTLYRPVHYSCGDPSTPIGVWFSRAKIESRNVNVTTSIIGKGHPNAC